MRKKDIDYSIYVVTDTLLARGRPIEEIIEKAIQGGATLIQYREKRGLSTRSMLEIARKLKTLTGNAKIPLIINDHLEIALAVGAKGIHLGQDDLPVDIARKYLRDSKVIGVSIRTEEEAREAIDAGADYLSISGVFPSSTKLDVGQPIGLDLVRKVVQHSPIPILAIGGVNTGNAGSVIRSGAHGIAVTSSVMTARDPAAAIRSLYLAIRRSRVDS